MIDTIVVGGGQAGLAMGYYLAEQGHDFLILDAAAETGDAWRNRWDSLRLFTPAQYNSLPGYAFPYEHDYLPTKDEVAQYLADYAEKFDMPIAHNRRVTSVVPVKDGFEVSSTNGEFVARNVVIATGPLQKPRIPDFATNLQVQQMHSMDYRNPRQFPAGSRIMVVGAANSGVQIAAELAMSHEVVVASSRNFTTLPTFLMSKSIFWWLSNSGYFTVPRESHIAKMLRKREILIGKHWHAPVVGRAIATGADSIMTTQGSFEVDAVVWATGYKRDFSYVHAPVFTAAGEPVQKRGVTDVRGLYFLGMPWLHARGSALLGWVGNDAKYLASSLQDKQLSERSYLFEQTSHSRHAHGVVGEGG